MNQICEYDSKKLNIKIWDELIIKNTSSFFKKITTYNKIIDFFQKTGLNVNMVVNFVRNIIKENLDIDDLYILDLDIEKPSFTEEKLIIIFEKILPLFSYFQPYMALNVQGNYPKDLSNLIDGTNYRGIVSSHEAKNFHGFVWNAI